MNADMFELGNSERLDIQESWEVGLMECWIRKAQDMILWGIIRSSSWPASNKMRLPFCTPALRLGEDL